MDTLLAIFSESKGVSTDSRDELKDKIFFALKGEHFDGNGFACEAIRKGALCAVVDDDKMVAKATKAEQEKLFFVDDVLRTLQDLAALYRKHFDIPIVAITGTNGKTTTKELLIASLSKKFHVAGTSGNLNNHIGVPLTLLNISPKTEIAVVEMGANKRGDIAELCTIARPTHGLITNIGVAHLEGFGSRVGIIKTKGELYKFLNDSMGTIFINSKDETLMKMLRKIVTSRKAKVIKYDGSTAGFQEKNMSAARTVALHFGVPSKSIDEAFKNYKPRNMRNQKLKSKNGNEILLDAYNANPSSMKVAIESFLKEKNSKSKWLILGDMKELGKQSVREHVKIVKHLKTQDVSNAILIGKEFYKTKSPNKFPSTYIFFKTKEDFRKSSIKNELSGCSILIKGSRGMKMEELVEIL